MKNNLGQISLNSMQKYQPRIHVVEFIPAEIKSENVPRCKTFVFDELQFIAVTAYQVSVEKHVKTLNLRGTPNFIFRTNSSRN